jgi:hypothetical protein
MPGMGPRQSPSTSVSTETFDLYRLAPDYLGAGDPRAAVATLEYALRDLPDDRALQRLQAQALYAFPSLGRAERAMGLEPSSAA